MGLEEKQEVKTSYDSTDIHKYHERRLENSHELDRVYLDHECELVYCKRIPRLVLDTYELYKKPGLVREFTIAQLDEHAINCNWMRLE